MDKRLYILILIIFSFLKVEAQQVSSEPVKEGYMTSMCVYKGDTIPSVKLRTIYVFPNLTFKSERQRKHYNKLIRDVKKVLPISKEVNAMVIETYEYLQTLPDEKSRNEHIRAVEKSVKKQYTPRMKRLTFSQGKLLIKLVNRSCNQTSYQLVKAFMGPFKAGFYQAFAAIFGASLKKEYHPEDEDQMIERIIIMVENGQL